jgi:hypothetical protein
MNKLPTNHHRNKFTGEILAQSVEVCSGCHLNFATTAAGDKHRSGKITERVCLSPKDAKLIKLINKFGSVIYKSRNDKDPRWEFTLVQA